MRLHGALGLIQLLHMLQSLSAFSVNTRKTIPITRRFVQSTSVLRSLSDNHAKLKQFYSSMELTSKSSTSWNIHRDSQSNARKYNVFSSRLYSVTLDKVDSSSENESTSNADVGEPFFEGELVSFITANDGISVAAMKVRDDEIINSGFSASATSTSTNMFGGAQIPSSAKSASKKNTGGQGKHSYSCVKWFLVFRIAYSDSYL